MGDSGKAGAVIIVIIIVLLLLWQSGLLNARNGNSNPPLGGTYWTLDLSTNAGSASVTNLPVGNSTHALNESVFVSVTKLKVQQNPTYPEAAWLQWIRFRLDGYYEAYGVQNITVGPAGNRSVIKLEAIFSAELVVFFPSATFARGQTYTVSLKFVNQYAGFHNAVLMLDDRYTSIFSSVKIGFDYSLGTATSFVNCLNTYTPAGLKHIEGAGSSGNYPYGSVTEWIFNVTVRPTAMVGSRTVGIPMGGTGDDNIGAPAFNGYGWAITVT